MITYITQLLLHLHYVLLIMTFLYKRRLTQELGDSFLIKVLMFNIQRFEESLQNSDIPVITKYQVTFEKENFLKI